MMKMSVTTLMKTRSMDDTVKPVAAGVVAPIAVSSPVILDRCIASDLG